MKYTFVLSIFLLMAPCYASAVDHPSTLLGASGEGNLTLSANEGKRGLIIEDRPIDVTAPPGTRLINGSLARFAGEYVLALRLDPVHEQGNGCGQRLAMVALDANFVPCGEVQLLETSFVEGVCPTAEDPRLIEHAGRLFVVYNSTMDGRVYHSQRDIYLLELLATGVGSERRFLTKQKKQLRMADGKRRLTEKNWTPFSHNGELYFIYETNPPVVASLSEEAWQAPGQIAELRATSHLTAKIAEPFGSMRGGTPAVLVDGLGYLSFYHTFLLVGRSAPMDPYSALYMAGAYTFSPEPPFAIERILTMPLVPATAYDDTDLFVDGGRKLGWVTYPQGIVVDGNVAFVSYAQNDRRIRVMTIDLRHLRTLLQPAPAEHTIER